jgi:hypothetical protein
MFTRSWMISLLGFSVAVGGLRAGDGNASVAPSQVEVTGRDAREEILYQLRMYRRATVLDLELSFRSTDGEALFDVCLKQHNGSRGDGVALVKEMDLRFVESPKGTTVLLHLKQIEMTYEDGSKASADELVVKLHLP